MRKFVQSFDYMAKCIPNYTVVYALMKCFSIMSVVLSLCNATEIYKNDSFIHSDMLGITLQCVKFSPLDFPTTPK